MRKFAIFAIIAFMFGACQTDKKQEITIGVLLPLTGDAAVYGKAIKNGFELAYSQSKIKSKIMRA